MIRHDMPIIHLLVVSRDANTDGGLGAPSQFERPQDIEGAARFNLNRIQIPVQNDLFAMIV